MELLTFHLADREFGVDLGRVLEIVTPPPITRVPETPPALIGVVGLRGDPIPVVDAGLRLAGRAIERSGRTPIVVLSATIDGRPSTFGLLVEAAGRRIAVDQLLPWSGGLARFTGDDPCIGFADVDDQIVLVLDVDKLLHVDRVAAMPPALPSRERPPPLPVGPSEPPPLPAKASEPPPLPAKPGGPPPLPSKDAAPAVATPPPALRALPPPPPAPAAKPPPVPHAPDVRPPVAAPRPPPEEVRPTAETTSSVRLEPWATPAGAGSPPGATAGEASARQDSTARAAPAVAAHHVPTSTPAAPAAAAQVAQGNRSEPPGSAAAPPDPRLDREGVYPVPPPPPPPPPSVQRSADAPMEPADRPPLGRVEHRPSRPIGWLVALGLVLLLLLAGVLFASLNDGKPSGSARRPEADGSRRTEPTTSGRAPSPSLSPAVAGERGDSRPSPTPVAAPPSPPQPPPATPAPNPVRTALPLPPAMVVTPETPACEIHEVQPGDTLWWISAQKLGNPYRWPELFGENRASIVDPNVIEVHDRIRIPGACTPPTKR